MPTKMNIGTSHCFPLNGDPNFPLIHSIEGIRQEYRKQLPNIQLSGPTYFSEIIKQFNTYATGNAAAQTYQVLLILTDGEIHDMSQVKKLIVESSSLPTSIIIVGVGNEAFEMMEELDSDEALLRDDNGRAAKRDIVQFVRFRESMARGNLAEEVLKEIPEQVCLYMEGIGFKPTKVQAD